MSNAEISIDGLSVTEKLWLMERIWADLEKQASDIPMPDWHGDVLSRRRQSVKKGEVEFSDWADAKQRLQQRHA